MSKVSSNWYYHSRCVWPGMPKLPEITNLLSMKACYKSILWLGWLSIPKVSIIAILECLHNISKKKLEMKLIFFLHQNFLQVDFNILCIKLSTRWYYRYCWSWSSILKVLKVTKFQYLYSISKKKLRMEFIFSMQMEKARHDVQSTKIISVPAIWQRKVMIRKILFQQFYIWFKKLESYYSKTGSPLVHN